MGRKRKKKKPMLIKYLFISMLILSMVTVGLIVFIDILPTNYLWVLIGVFTLFDFVISCLLFSDRTFTMVFGGLISTAYLFLMIFAIIYELNTIDFLKKIGKSEFQTLNYSVITLKDSKYNELDDIKGKTVGVVEDYDEAVLSKLGKKVNVKYDQYESYFRLVDKLQKGKLEVIVLEDSVLSILNDESHEFINSTKTIYKFSVDIKQKSIKNKVNIVKKPFNIFLSGIDTYGSINSVSRSDVNIILSVNPEKGKIIITSIPRDYYVKLHKNGEYDKLTHAGIYGVDESVSTIEDLLGIDINYYVKVNFTSLVKFVDTIDGIDVDSKYAFKSDDGYSYNVGKNHLNGKEALSFARERHALPKGDKSRGENHQAILTGIINKVSNKSILVKYNNLLKSLKPSIVTNFTNSEITSFVKNQIKKDTKWQIEYVNLDGTDGYEYTYSYQRNKLYVMIPDESTIETAKEKINELIEKGSK